MRLALLASHAFAAILLVAACARGTESTDLGDAGGVPTDGGRDGTTLPRPVGDSGPGPEEDAGEEDSAAPPAATHVVINELLSGSGEFIELYNPTQKAVQLTDWEVRYASSTGGAGPKHTFSTGEAIGAGAYVVLSASDGTWSNGMAASAGQVGLFDSSGKRIDGVAYGSVSTGTFREGQSAPVPPTDGSIGRRPNGVDSNNNSRDFRALTTPSPGEAN